MLEIRLASQEDWPGIAPVFFAVNNPGDVFPYDPNLSDEEARAAWFAKGHEVFVAMEEGRVVGSYWIRPNQPFRGAHVANAGYMVDPNAAGKGVGRAMGLHSLEVARERGYRAMQFNLVVATNERAVALWKSLGFRILTALPKAFRHAELGFVDVYVMHQELVAEDEANDAFSPLE